MKAAIFDLDGTLLDSMPIWSHAGEIYLSTMNLKAEENLGDKLLEMNMKEGAEYLKQNYNLSYKIEEICTGINNVIREAYHKTIPLKENAKAFLEWLKENDIKIALCTNTDRELFEPALKRLEILDFFDGIFTATEMKTSKNHPEIFYSVSEHLKVLPEDTYVFEDALYSIRTASKAGYKTAALYDDANKKNWEEIKKVSTIYCYNFNDLKKFLEDQI